MSDQFRYQAFISYSHGDQRWADWLHRALETYRVPRRVSAELGVAERLAPVFKDREELPSASDLGAVISQALEDSRSLVVICSPRSAQSRWVNEEVARFQKLGRGDRIFCLIVDGDPAASADSSEQCFVPALRQSEPLAADVRDAGDGRQNAKLKIVAGLLGIGLDVLKQRELQRRVQRLWMIAAASVVAVLITSTLAVVAVIARGEAQEAQRIAEQQAETARRTSDFLVELFSVVDPSEARGREVTAYEILERGRRQIDRELRDQPQIRNQLLTAMGRVYTGLGLYDRAVSLLEIGREADAELATQVALGNALYLQGSYPDAQRIFTQATARFDSEIVIPWLPEHSDALGGLADVLVELDRLADAEALYRQALARDRAAKPPDPEQLADSRSGLASVLLFAGRFDEARAHFEQALEDYRQAVGDDHPRTVETRLNLGTVLFFDEQASAAIETWVDALPYYRRVYGERHPELATLLNNIGRLQLEAGELASARTHLEESLAIDRALNRTNHEDLVFALNSLALVRAAQGDDRVALDYLGRAQSLARSTEHRLLGPIDINRALIRCSSTHRPAPGDFHDVLNGAESAMTAHYDAESWRWEALQVARVLCSTQPDDRDADFASRLTAFASRLGPGHAISQLALRAAPAGGTADASR